MNKYGGKRGVAPPLWAAAVLAAIVLAAPSLAAQQMLPELVRGVGIDQRLDQPVPLELEFRDESGARVQLAEYFGEKPVALALVYYECPNLCTMVLNGILRSVKPLSFTVGDEFEVVVVSIAPAETPELAAQKKEIYLRQYDRPGAEAGWHFLTGEEPAIRRLADAVGFRYRYDPETKLYAHASALMALTPEGRLSRYFYGIEYSARDLRLGLVEASQGRIGSPTDQVLLFCYQYDPMTGKYGLVIMRVLRAAGLATVLLLAMFLIVSLRRERQARRSAEGNGHGSEGTKAEGGK